MAPKQGRKHHSPGVRVVGIEELAGAPHHHYCKSPRSLQAALGQMKVNKRLETSTKEKRESRGALLWRVCIQVDRYMIQ